MLEMIDRWKQSGLSQKSFCEKEQIPYHKFYYWLRRSRHKSKATKQTKNADFVKPKIKEPVALSSIEVHSPKN